MRRLLLLFMKLLQRPVEPATHFLLRVIVTFTSWSRNAKFCGKGKESVTILGSPIHFFVYLIFELASCLSIYRRRKAVRTTEYCYVGRDLHAGFASYPRITANTSVRAVWVLRFL